MNSRQIVTAGSSGRTLAEVGERNALSVDRVDLSSSVSFFRRRLALIATVTGIALCIGAGISLIRDRLYTAEAVVSLEAPGQGPDPMATGAPAAQTPTSGLVDTQVEVITSRELATQVGTALGLFKGQDDAGRRAIIDDLQGNVAANRNGESYAVNILYTAETGPEAAQRVNEIAKQFTQWQLRSTRQQNQEAIKTIEPRLAELRRQAEINTAALQNYRIANNLLTTSGASLTEQEISSYNQAVTTARAAAAEDQARLGTAQSQLRSGSVGDDVGEALGSPVITALRAKEAEIGGQLANFSARYGPNHPELVRTRSELAEVRQQIATEITRTISNLQAKRAVSQQRLASLAGSLSTAQGKLSRNNSAMVGLNELTRNAQVSQTLYETYLNSYKQLIASEGAERPNARILTFAEVPVLPSSPNIPMNMLLSLVIGAGAGLLAAFLAETFFKGVTGPEEIETATGEHFLGSIPVLASVTKGKGRAVTSIGEQPRSAFAESFRSLRTSIEQVAFGPAQIIAVTSSLPKEGKSVTAICLAQTLARTGARTLLIDCDEASRGVSGLLRLDDGHPGLIQVLEGENRLDESLLEGDGGLAVLPIRRATKPGDAALTGEAMDEFIAALRKDFEYIVLDLPPVLPVAAARELAAKADATVMLIRWRKTPVAALQSALRQMPQDKINVVGVVITQVDMRRRSLFDRGDPAFYFREYRNYYA
ncbi:MAG: hypothetical protein JWQ16_522 [Novosphingobium sp.]|nr:hypothetical protein [Novosphingobium sp.]